MKVPTPVDKHVGSPVQMRRLMLSMSQEKLGDALNFTSKEATNRIGASRLEHIARILQVPVAFFGARQCASHK
jgi:hypothetical protein